MKWVNSAGGPLICAERFISASWMGINGLSAGDVTEAKTDYDRACATTEYLETIRCNDGNVLVLGDEPLRSAFLNTETGKLAIARWVYAQSDQDVNVAMTSSPHNACELAQRVAFESRQGLLILFDAALQGSDVAGRQVHIQTGLYHVTTEKLERERRFSFIIHRFLRLQS